MADAHPRPKTCRAAGCDEPIPPDRKKYCSELCRRRVKDRKNQAHLADHETPRGPPRPCINCGAEFQPTMKRWRLCQVCYAEADDEPEYPIMA